jgi:hypothetical protein
MKVCSRAICRCASGGWPPPLDEDCLTGVASRYSIASAGRKLLDRYLAKGHADGLSRRAGGDTLRPASKFGGDLWRDQTRENVLGAREAFRRVIISMEIRCFVVMAWDGCPSLSPSTKS